jgi:hypothetical protein
VFQAARSEEHRQTVAGLVPQPHQVEKSMPGLEYRVDPSGGHAVGAQRVVRVLELVLQPDAVTPGLRPAAVGGQEDGDPYAAALVGKPEQIMRAQDVHAHLSWEVAGAPMPRAPPRFDAGILRSWTSVGRVLQAGRPSQSPSASVTWSPVGRWVTGRE